MPTELLVPCSENRPPPRLDSSTTIIQEKLKMRNLKLMLIAGFTAVCIAAGNAALAPTPAHAAMQFSCGNTYCMPGDQVCHFFSNWSCALDQTGCIGANKCQPQ